MLQASEGAGSGGFWSDDVYVALAPARRYRELLARDEPTGWVDALQRPGFVVMLLGTLVPMAAVGRVTLGLVVTAALSWSFAVAIQVLIGLAIVASAASRKTTMARALDLYFAGHVPWSLWLSAIAAWITSGLDGLSFDVIAFSAMATAIWTAVIVAAFCREVLGTTASGAWLRVAAQQAIVWAVVFSYIAWAAGGWFRLVE